MSKNYFELKQIEHMLHSIIELLKHLNNEKSKSGIYTQTCRTGSLKID